MANKARHAFGNLSEVQKALSEGKIDAYDILFLDGDTAPKVGWIDRNGIFRLVENETDLSELEEIISTKANASDVEALGEEIATKVTAEEVDAKVATANAYTDKMVEAAMGEHLTKKYEITDVPEGTLVDYREDEIRVMCKADAVFTKQSVGNGGDANSYYMTFKTYFPENATGYIEHLGNQVDEEILTSFSVDEYGRKYQPTWLALAKYDESTKVWNYYGNNSTSEKMVGWDYRIDWYNADGEMIESDGVRINLSNENCHFSTKPYYVDAMMTEVETLIETKVEEVYSAYEIIEF